MSFGNLFTGDHDLLSGIMKGVGSMKELLLGFSLTG